MQKGVDVHQEFMDHHHVRRGGRAPPMRVTSPLTALTIVFTAAYCDASSRPHIVMVLGDDIGFGDVGYADDQVSCQCMSRLTIDSL